MRTITEIDEEFSHLAYAQALLDERRAAAKKDRDLLREDKFSNNRLTKRLAEFFKIHGLYIVSLQSCERTKGHYELAKQIWRARGVLLPFIKHLSTHKITMSFYETTDLSPAQINDIKNLCDVLAEKQWFTFQMLEDGFEISPSFTGEQKSFVHYGWSEEITLYLIDKTLKEFTNKRRLKHKLFWNLKLKLIDPI